MTFEEIRNTSAPIIAKYFTRVFPGVEDMPVYDKAYSCCYETPLEFSFVLDGKENYTIEDIKALRNLHWRPGCGEGDTLGTEEERRDWDLITGADTTDERLRELFIRVNELSIVKREYD